MRKHIPNIITLFNLFFGCWAIVFTFQKGAVASVDQVGDIIIEIPEKLYLASVCIMIAAIIDFFDGFVARFLKLHFHQVAHWQELLHHLETGMQKLPGLAPSNLKSSQWFLQV